jgi:hypothetical protein
MSIDTIPELEAVSRKIKDMDQFQILTARTVVNSFRVTCHGSRTLHK